MADNSLVVQLGLDMKNLETGLNKSNQLLKGFKESVADIGKSLVAAFAIERVAEFGFEVAKLSGQADGIKRVFNQLQGSAEVLQQMKDATQGTVSDLELMKYAVQADNFNIPLTQMGSLFEFAHQRALATGQSVDYLVQSIVTGIGRKSPLILDNLGISAVALREKLKGVGTESASVADIAKVVGEIAHESLNKFGIAAETTASRMEAVNASWENLKVKIGDVINSGGVLANILKYATDELNIYASENISLMEKLLHATAIGGIIGQDDLLAKDKLATQKKINEEKQREANIQNTINQFFEEGWGSVTRFEKAIQQNVDKQAIIQGIINQLLVGHTEEVKNIAFYEKEIADLKEKEKTAVGQELSQTQRKIEQEEKKLELLKQQFALERDRAQTEIIKKQKDFKAPDKSLLAPITAGIIPLEIAMERWNAIMDKNKEKLASWGTSMQKTGTVIVNASQAIQSGIMNAANVFAESLASIAQGANVGQSILSGLIGAAAAIMRQFGELLIAGAVASIALGELITNPFTAMAAGIALVALSSAVSGAAKGIVKGGTGGGASVAHHSYVTSGGNSYRDTSTGVTQVNGMVKISGQDLWVILSNYKTNSNYTRIG